MTKSINDILQQFREEARNNRDLGDRFERLMVGFLKKDPVYSDLFSAVWLWGEWPERGNKPDVGIDIVAQERGSGDVWAIQCKFFDPAHTLQKADIDSFFTASGKDPFKKRLIISTTDNWSKHAEDACKNQQIPVSRLRVQDLDESPVDWAAVRPDRPTEIKFKDKKHLRPHQKEAHDKVIAGLKAADRGKLIMACGTGKTFTSLRIAETMAPAGGCVLFLVPSISLISQSVAEWAAEAEAKFSFFAVCSDPKAGQSGEEEDISTHDLAFPAHTNPKLLGHQIEALRKIRKKNVTVIFSTYQSIAVVQESQEFGTPVFDLVICDEAHRTTGIERTEYDKAGASAFVLVHKPDFIKAKKRLYMTATPRIYDDVSKGKAKDADIDLYSMDDPSVYGEELYRLDFSEAVRRGLLSDYKVMVLAVDEKHVSKAFQSQIADRNKELNLDDVIKIVGCYNGLQKKILPVDGDGAGVMDQTPMRRAVAFNRSIKESKKITELFEGIVRNYVGERAAGSEEAEEGKYLRCEVDHVDGTHNALIRNKRLQWLKEDTTKNGNVCRILSNARCLSEGVNVPALDAVMFLNPRNSVVDVVQSVGRVMRKVEGKQYGYIILPVGVPADVSPEEALANNQKYKVVWQVLQALRAHDDRFNAMINQIDINKQRPGQIQIIGVGENKEGEKGSGSAVQTVFNFPHLEEWRDAIFAKIVVKCGNRRYWESWAQDVAKIADRNTTRIKALVETANSVHRKKFETFLNGLRKTLNPSISENDAIEMLSQHIITKPVFDALFEGYEFTKRNPVSKTMQKMLDLLEGQSLEKETEKLEKFYESVKERVRGIDNVEGKQKIIIELYDKFFKTAFPRMAERLGIVYTPVEVVDFILKSADAALRGEFGVGLSDKDVHVLDPFTGTGTFIVRLLQSGLINEKDLVRKYREELHANEIILLAYYIAAINIEEAYHGRAKAEYEPFEGIVLTDTFQLSEGKGAFEDPNFQVNSERADKQNRRDIRVIVGNPPYSAGQTSQNDNNQNLKYPGLDQRIANTYAANAQSANINSLYDSYIRAIRWASDRIKDKGIICFVSNAGFIDTKTMSGLRKTIHDEFSRIYCFNLRGNQRTSGELSRKEGGKIFGSGSRAQIAITLFIKNKQHKSPGKIFYHDIGDYLSREEKLLIIQQFGDIRNIGWAEIDPDKNHDWINKRDEKFEKFIPLGSKVDKGSSDVESIFVSYSLGTQTNRDAWNYNYSQNRVAKNISHMIDVYNQQVEVLNKSQKHNPRIKIFDVITNDSKKIKWSSSLLGDCQRGVHIKFNNSAVRPAAYRPFTKQQIYSASDLIHRPGKMPMFFPDAEKRNFAICVTGVGATKDFSALIVDIIPDLEIISKSQCFPLYFYHTKREKSGELNFGQEEKTINVSDFALKQFRLKYEDNKVQKEDVFYFVYGLLHSPEYKKRFKADLAKTLPRIPFAKDFWAFSKAGRKLAELHLGYENIEPYPVKVANKELALDSARLYEVQKMRFGKNASGEDKTVIQFNSHITITGIPLEAYEYVVNGKSAIEWVMERYQVSQDPESGIVNDPNDWAREHEDPQYILNLLKRVVTVSVETMKIVKALPPLEERT